MRNNQTFFRADIIALLLIVVAGAGLSLFFMRGGGDELVVYCAHDEVYSRQVFDAFTRETGINVAVRYDTEANKSLGLTESIIAERDQPRCDVLWNNQLLGTLDLKERGLLQAYQGPGYARMADLHKDAQGFYTGFAARLRVYIVNTQTWPAATVQSEAQLDSAITTALQSEDLSRIAVARPMYGTTLSHYALLWHVMGADAMKAWHHDWRRRGVVERGGNATVKDLIAHGVCDIGLTDTDDYFVAKDAGRPVTMTPIYVADVASGERYTICIPNTVAIIKGTKRLENAQKLVDFLLCEKVELLLANSKARQIPLGAVDESQLSDEVKQMRLWAQRAYPLTGLHEARRQCLDWLKLEYVH